MNVSRETREKLQAFTELLLKWNRTINLISSADERFITDRHVADSLAVYSAGKVLPSSWCDLGSGGGFPAVVIACANDGAFPVTMIESDARKATFLRTAIRELNLTASVVHMRIEDAPRQAADVISARALADLNHLLYYAERHAEQETVCVFPKGVSYDAEIVEARRDWIFDLDIIPSKTSEHGVILRIRGLSRAKSSESHRGGQSEGRRR